MRPYLLAFGGPPEWRQAILDFLDKQPDVLNWYAFFPAAIFFISRKGPQELSQRLHSSFPNIWFVIAEVQAGRSDGWLPEAAWNFISNPQSSGRWPDKAR